LEFQTQEQVKNYYGKVLKSKNDLQTSACCVGESVPKHLRKLLSDIHPEVSEKFYGCGSPIPSELEGRRVLDLGSGTGRDVFLLSRLVGPDGQVIGVDMTDEQIEVARRHIDYHRLKYGHSESNVVIKKGYIEDLKSLEIESESVDLVISNCVINLSPNKEKVFSEIFRVLRPGGELYFSDVFSDRRIPKNLREDPVVLGECLGGALYFEDFRRMMRNLGFPDYRIVSSSSLEITQAEIAKKVEQINFSSVTIRAFKVELEDIYENYGHVAKYLGTIDECPREFILDDQHIFKHGLPVPICGNTANILTQSRFKKHFEVIGDFSKHYGVFLKQDIVKPKTKGSCC